MSVSSAHYSRSTDWCRTVTEQILIAWVFGIETGCFLIQNPLQAWRIVVPWATDLIQTSGLCHLLPITVSPSEFIQTWSQSNNKTTKMLLLFLHSDSPCFSSTNKLLKGALYFLSTTLFSPRSLRQQRFIFERDISTLTGGRRGGTFVTLLLSLVIFCCGGSQMVWFSAHMVLFLRDHCSWPAWFKKKRRKKMRRC